MGILKNILLWSSDKPYLRNRFTKFIFIRKSVKRFIPGENLEEALTVAQKNASVMFTYLGENVDTLEKAEENYSCYIKMLESIAAANLKTEVSLKLTQLGMDISREHAYSKLKNIASRAAESGNFIWLDMEGSTYTDMTLEIYKRMQKDFSNVGISLQSYLIRSADDLAELKRSSSVIRLVEGAYKEPKQIAFKQKKHIDDNFLDLSKKLLDFQNETGVRTAFATHDIKLIDKIIKYSRKLNIPEKNLEFQMIYGIRKAQQQEYTRAGYKINVLICFGEAWFPWYMRRLAEHPANLLYVLKNLFAR